MKEVYQKWYKYNGDKINNKIIRVEFEIKIEIKNWGT